MAADGEALRDDQPGEQDVPGRQSEGRGGDVELGSQLGVVEGGSQGEG